jgi:hypothetical protein
MKCATFNTNLLRAELIYRIERGDTSARKLLSELAEYHGDSVPSLVRQYKRTAGSLFLERFLAVLGALCLGLSLGVCGLTVAELVPAEIQSLLLCSGAFLLAQWSFSQYGKRSDARYYATGFSRVLACLQRRARVA